jgi:hypothetical protein
MVPWNRAYRLGRAMVMGVIGAFAGAFISRLLGYQEGDPAAFVTSALGAVVSVALYQARCLGRREMHRLHPSRKLFAGRGDDAPGP